MELREPAGTHGWKGPEPLSRALAGWPHHQGGSRGWGHQLPIPHSFPCSLGQPRQDLSIGLSPVPNPIGLDQNATSSERLPHSPR